MTEAQEQPVKSNVPELSVSELAFSLKRTLEETFGRVRVRGELSGLKLASSGHLYGSIKDENANVDIVCWKGMLSKLSIKPADGLEVICTGKVSSFPKSSKYQIIVDSIELAGEGALLKMLEDRKKMLAAEGLFAPERKRSLPFLPQVIGVVTSPTGAVIRDIIHRLNDRFPRHVIVWPVPVQGDGAAEKIAAAIDGFNALPATGGAMPRPDLLIVARGGGSLEDLMAFNEEVVVRAVANCTIPLISAVGHETDTTLIDYVSDLRAPTPTGAAEMAVPRRDDLRYTMVENQKRMIGGMRRMMGELSHKLSAQAAKLGDPAQILELKSQQLDHTGQKLGSAFERGLSQRQNRIRELGAMLKHPKSQIDEKTRTLALHAASLKRVGNSALKDKEQNLNYAAKMLNSLSYQNVLKRGYVVVRDAGGKIIGDAKQAIKEQNIMLEFKDNEKIAATIGENAPKNPISKKKTLKAKDQGQLF